MLRQAALLTIIGLIAGLAGGGLVSRMLARFFYGVRPFEPSAVAATSAVVGCVSLLAAFLPRTPA